MAAVADMLPMSVSNPLGLGGRFTERDEMLLSQIALFDCSSSVVASHNGYAITRTEMLPADRA